MRRHIPLILPLIAMLAAPASAAHPIKFDVKFLAVDANEGCDIADVDKDGRLDVVAGRNWYHNDDWVVRPVRSIEDWNEYVRSNGDCVYDVDGDGYPDVMAMDFTSPEVYWYRNPGPFGLKMGHLWTQHLLVDTQQGTNESCCLEDITGDGKPEWLVNQWNADKPTIIWSLTTREQDVETQQQGRKVQKVRQMMPALEGHTIGSINGHGIGFGDINNDGRDDIVFGKGWYERPTGDPLAQEWTFHDDWDLHASCPMLVYDVDGDKINDLVWSDSHAYGIHLWRGTGEEAEGKLQFENTTFDNSFSQAHCLHLADLDGDGTQELITGKRVRAHNGKDPGSGEPPIMRYYVWNAKTKSFEGYTINEGLVGGGLQVRTADLDADGDNDIVVAGKDGTQILFNRRIP